MVQFDRRGGADGAQVRPYPEGHLSYVDFLVPGFIVTNISWGGMGTAVGVAEDVEHGFVDRLRSLPIPRASVLIGRGAADVALMAWALAIATGLGFAVGFRPVGSAAGILAAFGLCLVFGWPGGDPAGLLLQCLRAGPEHAQRSEAVQRGPADHPDG